MTVKSVKDAEVKGKRVISRVDFNVLIENGKIKDNYRIKRTLPTIKLLRKNGAKIIIISHLTEGRAKTLRPVVEYLKKYFPIKFISDKNINLIKKKTDGLKNGEIALLENIRNFKEEERNEKKFAKKLASLGEIYVNDAFSASHRSHASIVGITKYLPSYAGLLFEEELKNLESAFRPKRPFLLILGGVKFGTKLGVLEKFVKIADKIFIGGALANNFFKLHGINLGNSLFDEKVSIKKYLNNKKIILPVDAQIKDSAILDCGPKTIKIVNNIIRKSKFVVWNGPLGNFEKKGFDKGTIGTAKAITNSHAKSIIGGGDTIAAVNQAGISLNKFSFVSTAGGAMLEFLAKGTLPGIEALKR